MPPPVRTLSRILQSLLFFGRAIFWCILITHSMDPSSSYSSKSSSSESSSSSSPSSPLSSSEGSSSSEPPEDAFLFFVVVFLSLGVFHHSSPLQSRAQERTHGTARSRQCLHACCRPCCRTRVLQMPLCPQGTAPEGELPLHLSLSPRPQADPSRQQG